MEWHAITSPEDVDTVVKASHDLPQLILKHSTRCNISSMAKARLERQYADSKGTLPTAHLLLVVEDRAVSAYAADTLQVHHESPQAILLKDGDVILDQSHYGITLEEIQEVL